jgi:hypothetical protein
MKINKTERTLTALIIGIIVSLFGILIIIGLVYRPQFFNIRGENKLSQSKVQTPRELGVKRLQQIMEGDLSELKLLSDTEAFCQLNIEGRPEDYSDQWQQFFVTLQQKKNISITGWQFKTQGSPTYKGAKPNIILGVALQVADKK